MSVKRFLFEVFKAYIRYVHEAVMVRRRYVVGQENLPPEGSRYFIISNHQNTANDPLNIIFSLPRRYYLTVMARANVFQLHPALTRFFHTLGLVPAFRAGFEGLDDVAKNQESFDLIAQRVNQRRPFLIFPEGGHTQGHYLDPFSTGFVRMAFHVAASNDWKEDLLIVPTAHHYSDYFDVQADFVWSVGKPISIQPYYEEYQHHPYRVMRRIKNQMQESVRSMMLDMGGEDYAQKDFLRRSALNPATLQDLELPQRMRADQQFIDSLRANPQYAQVIALAGQLQEAEQKMGLNDITIARKPSLAKALAVSVALALLFPLWVISLWPNLLCYRLPLLLLRTDLMFTNTYRYILSVLVLYPLCALLTLGVMWGVFGQPWMALVWILLWLPLARFAHYYRQSFRQVVQAVRLWRHRSSLAAISDLRQRIAQLLNHKGGIESKH